MDKLTLIVLPLASIGLLSICSPADAATSQFQREHLMADQAEGPSDQSASQDGITSNKVEQGEGQVGMGKDGAHQPPRSEDSWKEANGKIERVKTVAIRGTGQKHLTVLLGTREGRRMVVDLGPAGRFRDVELRAGDWIVARGPVGRVNDRRVIFAHQVNVSGDIIRIDRQTPVKYSGPKMHSIKGKVAIIKDLKIKGGDQVHQVIRIMTDEGKPIVADLGEKSSLKDITLAFGQEISVEGPMARLSGKPFLLAQKVTSQGKTAHIERPFLSAMTRVRESQGTSAQTETRAENGTRQLKGEVVVKGEVLNIDRDGFYVVRDPSGKEVHLLVAEDLDEGLQVGDQVQAQVLPDGSVTSILRSSDAQFGETRREPER